MSRKLLRDTHPNFFKEICSVEPESVTPESLSTGSGRIVLWKCEKCKNEWRGRVVDRTKRGGRGCPKCLKSRAFKDSWIPSPGNSLGDLHPHIATELIVVEELPERTALQIYPSSSKLCIWQCFRCGNKWRTSPNTRIRGSGCPECARTRTKTTRASAVDKQQSLSALNPHISKELIRVIEHGHLNSSNLHPASIHDCLWRCSKCGHEWMQTAKKRTYGGAASGCPRCARKRTLDARRIALPGGSVADLYPAIAAEFVENLESELTLSQLKPYSNYSCLWRCSNCKHEWQAVIENRTIGKTGCPACFESRRGQGKRRPKSTSQTAYEALKPIAGEFIRNLTSPGLGLKELRPSSADECLWKCTTCGHEWIARVGSRLRSHKNRSGSGCRKCYDKRIVIRRRKPAPGKSLEDLYPRISKSFVRNLTTPGEGPEILKSGSNDRCLWKCPNGHTWETNVLSRTKGSECPRCTSAGRSRFEVEVQHLLKLACKIEVICDHELIDTEGSSGRPFRVDLYFPDISLYVDLDPLYTHQHDRVFKKDCLKSTSLSHLNFVRIRSVGLPYTPGEQITVHDYTQNGVDPWTWATAIRPIIISEGVTFRNLTPLEHRTALSQAAQDWSQITGRVRYTSVADRFPHLVDEFQRNLSNGAFDLSLRSVSSPDVAEWKCKKCGSIWQALIRNRARGSGCHSCWRKEGDARNRSRSMADPGQSLADLYPSIATRFIRCLKDSTRNPNNLRPRSNLPCEWYCQTGLHVFTAAVHEVTSASERRCCKLKKRD